MAQAPRADQAPRRFVSIGVKLAVAIAVVVTLASGTVLVEIVRREHASILHAKELAVTMMADLFALEVAAPLDFQDAEATSAELAHLASNPDVVWAAAWLEGGNEPLAVHGAGSAQVDRSRSRTTRLDDRVEAVRVIKNRAGKTIGAAVVHVSLARENAAYESARARLAAVWLALTAGLIAALVAIARRTLTGPLEALARAARRVERGQTSEPLSVRSSDELGRLAASFNAMQAAIADREAKLAAANASLRELFDNLRQGIVVFGEDGRVDAVGSRAATDLFGPSLEGKSLRELLYPGREDVDPEVVALEELVALAFAIDLERAGELAELAPREVSLARAGEELFLALELHPIAREGKIARWMLLATDVSRERRIAREAETRGAEYERALAAMRRHVAGSGDAFASFVARTRERLDRCRAIGERAATSDADRTELLQHAHTIRGEARAFDLAELAAEMVKVEDAARALGADRDHANTRRDLASALDRGATGLDHAVELFAIASPIGRAALDRTSVARADVARLAELLRGRDDELGAIAARLAARPFGEAATILAERAPGWAEELGKRVRVDVEGRDVPVPPELAKVLGGVLAHFVRNAIAHGIEAPEERETQGKSATGEIRIVCRADEGGPSIEISDDGRGLRSDAIVARARALGVDDPDAAPESLIFRAGLTTEEGPARDAAGVGVGLSAVRADLAAVGYAITTTTSAGAGTRFVLSPTRTR